MIFEHRRSQFERCQGFRRYFTNITMEGKQTRLEYVVSASVIADSKREGSELVKLFALQVTRFHLSMNYSKIRFASRN